MLVMRAVGYKAVRSLGILQPLLPDSKEVEAPRMTGENDGTVRTLGLDHAALIVKQLGENQEIQGVIQDTLEQQFSENKDLLEKVQNYENVMWESSESEEEEMEMRGERGFRPVQICESCYEDVVMVDGEEGIAEEVYIQHVLDYIIKPVLYTTMIIANWNHPTLPPVLTPFFSIPCQ